MEKELNIAAILKDKPKGTMLWSDTFGKAELLCMNQGSYPICLGLSSGISIELTEEGKYFKDVVESLCCIFPSRNMRDWSKFAWKKGDVLGFANVIVIFDCWVEDDYTEFQAAFECNQGGEYDEGNDYYTSEFDKVSSDIAQEFIKNVEAHYGGKLNLETLEIEKPQFKDGDIVSYGGCSAICKKLDGETLYFYASTTEFGLLFDNNINSSFQYRPAKEEEKQQLFSALEKNGKAWDAEKKQIVDLPKKCEFKAFDKVLARDTNDEKWLPKFFSDYDERGIDSYPYGVINSGGESVYYKQCIPYNDQTAHLLGTTDDWKGGEG